MKFSKLRNWDKEADIEGLLFFYQRTEELLFDYTLDSYKPKLLCSSLLCEEVLQTISEIRHENLDKQNLKHLIPELETLIRSDPISKSLIPNDPAEYFKDTGKNYDDIDKLEARVQLLAKCLQPEVCIIYLKKFISKAVKDNKKKDIDSGINQLVTLLLGYGYSKQFIFNETKNFFRSRKINDPKIVDTFLEKFTLDRKTYNCYFKATNIIKDLDSRIQKFGCEQVDSLFDVIPKEKIPKKFQTISTDKTYIYAKDVIAMDVFSARENAEQRLMFLSDLYSVFHHKTKIQWDDVSVVEDQKTKEISVANKETNVLLRGIDMKSQKASQEFENLLNKFTLIYHNEARFTFKEALSLHGISLTTENAQNQLLNLWIAIETICPKKQSTSKIQSITTSLTPILYVRYLRKLITNYVMDISRYKVSDIRDNIDKEIEDREDARLVSAFKILHHSELASVRKSIYDQTDDFPLLRYRTYELQEKFKNKKSIKKLIDAHIQKVSWQIHRIYRTRNLIVHSANKVQNVNYLAENTHSYLDSILDMTMRLSCSRYMLDDFNQIFEHSRLHMKKMEQILSGQEELTDKEIQALISMGIQ